MEGVYQRLGVVRHLAVALQTRRPGSQLVVDWKSNVFMQMTMIGTLAKLVVHVLYRKCLLPTVPTCPAPNSGTPATTACWARTTLCSAPWRGLSCSTRSA